MWTYWDIVVGFIYSSSRFHLHWPLAKLDSKQQPTRLDTDSYFGLVGKSTLRGVSENEIYFYDYILLYLGVKFGGAAWFLICTSFSSQQPSRNLGPKSSFPKLNLIAPVVQIPSLWAPWTASILCIQSHISKLLHVHVSSCWSLQ